MASQSTPEINIQPPKDAPEKGKDNRRVKSPSPIPPSQKSSKTPPPDAKKKKDGDLSPGKPRPRAQSTGSRPKSSDSKDELLERIKQGVRYFAADDFDVKRPMKEIMKWEPDLFSKDGTRKDSDKKGENSKGRGGSNVGSSRGKGGQGRGGKQTQPGNVRRSKSQDNLRVPGSKDNKATKDGSKLGKDRSSSVPRKTQDQIPPLFDVQRDGGNQHKRMLADRWFKKLDKFTDTLIRNYANSEYEKVRIAVLDTGVEKSARRHTPDFIRQCGQQIKGGRSFLGENNEDVPWNKDMNGHGTHVTGLLLRVAPRAEIYVARILKGWESTIDPKNVEEALKWAIDEWKVDIITMSFGFDKYHAGVEAQLNRASAEHILVFAAASNDGVSKSVNVAWPAREKTVFCVFSATGEGKNSSFNPPPIRGLNFATLGEEVESDWPIHLLSDQEKEEGISTARKSGTSFATPITAAIAALVLEFARQPPLSDTPEVARQLKKLDRMEEVLERMSEQNVGRYHYVYPWLLFNAEEMGRGTSKNDAYDRHSARGMVEGELVRLVSRHVQIF